MSADGPITEIGNLTGEPSSYPVPSVHSWQGWAPGDDLERVAELQWPNSPLTYRSMMNDAQANSLVMGLLLPIRAYRWYIEPNGAKPDIVQRISTDYNLPIGKDATEFNRRRGQRRFSFDKHLEDALRATYYGHYAFEQVGEIGEGRDGLPNDGKWHLRKLGVRAPRTITQINIDNDGSLRSIRQNQGMDTPPIDVSRLVWYAWDREGSNWVGRSMLRCIYRNHVVKDRVLRVGAINIERAGGVPFVNAPEGASADQIRELDALARKFRVGEGAGAALPHGAQLKFAMAASGDGAVAYIKQQNEEMARGFLQMVSMLGQTNSGSRALGETFHDILQTAQYTVAKWFADIFNEHVIEDDVEWNEGPEEEYAPLIAFDAGAQDPMIAMQEAALDNQDNPGGMNLQVTDPKLRAALGLPPSPWSRNGRIRTGHRHAGTTPRPEEGSGAGGIEAATLASQVSLPPRPLRREPYPHEIMAAVDFALVDSAHDAALMQIQNEVRLARSFQIDELHDAIVAADGDLKKLAKLTTSVSASDRIRAHLEAIASIGVDQAVQEASRQGVEVSRKSVTDLSASLQDRAEAIDALLTDDIVQSAQRQAIRLTGGGLSPAEVADETHVFLIGLTGAAMHDILSGAIQQSMNAGRKLVFQGDNEPGTLYASELLDTNTCSPCIRIDGTPYESIEAAERDYPTGGFKHCEGRERCRGTVIKVYDREGVT